MGKHDKVTAEKVAAIREEYSKPSADLISVANKFGLSTSTIQSYTKGMKSKGFTKDMAKSNEAKRLRNEEGLTLEAIGEILGVSKQRAAQLLKE